MDKRLYKTATTRSEMKHRVSNDNEDLELNQTVLVDLHIRAILTQFERQQKYMLNPSEKKKEEIRLHNEQIIWYEDALSISSKGCIQRFKDSYLISNTEIERKIKLEIERKEQIRIERKEHTEMERKKQLEIERKMKL